MSRPVGTVLLAGVVRAVLWVQRLLLLVLLNFLDEYAVRAVDKIVQDGINGQASFQCHDRFDRMDDGKWHIRS